MGHRGAVPQAGPFPKRYTEMLRKGRAENIELVRFGLLAAAVDWLRALHYSVGDAIRVT